MYSKLSTGEFVTKGTDRKAQFYQRRKWIEEAVQRNKGNEDDDDDEEDDD